MVMENYTQRWTVTLMCVLFPVARNRTAQRAKSAENMTAVRKQSIIGKLPGLDLVHVLSEQNINGKKNDPRK